MPTIPKATHSRLLKAKIQRQGSGMQDVYDSNWAKTSRTYRILNPLCEVCKAVGLLVDVTPGGYKGCVDHMVPVSLGGNLYNRDNLLALCKSCHDTKSNYERNGIGAFDIALDGDAKYIPKRREDVVAWLVTLTQRNRDA